MARKTREIHVRNLKIGSSNPIVVQSMCATKTRDIEATVKQVELLHKAGAGLVRIAVDNEKDVEALKEVRRRVKALLSVDLQENYKLALSVAPYVDKIRYNPGHLHHLDKDKSIEEKVEWIVDIAKKHDLAIRIGVNCGSVAPDFLKKFNNDRDKAIVESAIWHSSLMEKFGFKNYLVSLKDSNPEKVIKCNEAFSEKRPDVPLHLGVTEAGMPPDSVIKTRIAFEKLISKGIGDTIRVSLTVPFNEKDIEIKVGKKMLDDIENKRFITVPENFGKELNIISCPSCSRVENESFIKLAGEVKRMSTFAKKHSITIAVMGCRVNGPGETDDADLGLWCGPSTVVLKRKSDILGTYSYGSIIPVLKEKLESFINEKK